MGEFSPKAFLVDLDKVVVASGELQILAEKMAAREMAKSHKPVTAYECLLEEGEIPPSLWTPFKDKARRVIGSVIFGVPEAEDLTDRYRASVVEMTVEVATLDNAPFVEGAQQGLRDLQGHGRPIAAVTASHRDIYAVYDRLLGIGSFFDESVAFGEAGKNKPAPDPYLLAARRLGVLASESLVIEDSGSGIKSGLAAEARVMGIATEKTTEELLDLGAHYAAQDWPDLTLQVRQGLPL